MTRTKLGEVTWTDLQAVDIEKQSAFYEALFGWTHEDRPTRPGAPDYRIFFKDGAMVAGGAPMSPDMQGMPTFWAVYLATPDLDKTLAKATELGATVVMPAMDVMESGRMVSVADPTGGGIFFWQAKDHPGAELFMKPGAISWADLSTRDPEKAAAFFTDLFGWKVNKMEGSTPYWQFDVEGEGQGGIMNMPDMMGPDARPFWTVYFGTDNITASLEEAERLGGKVWTQPVDVGQGTSFAVLSDPAGAAFALLGPAAAA